MERVLWVAIGGALGSAARYLVTEWVLARSGPAFPWGTLAVNVVGSFLLGFLFQLALAVEAFPPTLRLALSAGVLGGFTTYSAFNQETLLALGRGDALHAGTIVLATLAGCLVAGFAGLALARLVVA